MPRFSTLNTRTRANVWSNDVPRLKIENGVAYYKSRGQWLPLGTVAEDQTLTATHNSITQPGLPLKSNADGRLFLAKLSINGVPVDPAAVLEVFGASRFRGILEALSGFTLVDGEGTETTVQRAELEGIGRLVGMR